MSFLPSSDCSMEDSHEEEMAGPFPIKCFWCSSTDNLMTHMEKHLKGKFNRKNVHCTKCGDGSFSITPELWNAHYANIS